MGGLGQVGVGVLLAFSVSGLNLIANADRQMNKLFVTSAAGNTQLSALGKNFVALAGAAILFAGGLAAVKGAMSNISAAADYQTEFAHVQGLLNVGVEAMGEFEDKALELAQTTRFTMAEVMSGFWQIISAGYSQAQAMDIIEVALQGAVMGNMEAAESVTMLGASLHSFGKPATDAREVLDQLTATVRTSMVQFPEISNAVSKFGGVMSNMDQDLPTAMAMYGVIRNTGMEASRAATNLKMLATELMTFRQAGIESLSGVALVDPLTGSFRDILDIISDVERAMPRVPEALMRGIIEEGDITGYAEQLLVDQIALYGKRALIGAMALRNFQLDYNGVLYEGIEGVKELRDMIQDSEGAAQSYYDTLMGTWNEQKMVLDALKNTISVQLGQPLMENLMPVLEKIIEAVRSVSVFLSEHPEVAKAIGYIGLIGGFVAMVAGGLAGIVIIVGFIKNALGTIGIVTMAAFGKFLLAIIIPLGWILLAIIAIVGIIALIALYGEEIGAFFVGLWEWIYARTENFWKLLGTVFTGIWLLLKFIFDKIVLPALYIIGTILSGVFAVVSVIIGIIAMVARVVLGLFESVAAIINAIISGDLSALKDTLKEIWDKVGVDIGVIGELFFKTIVDAILAIPRELMANWAAGEGAGTPAGGMYNIFSSGDPGGAMMNNLRNPAWMNPMGSEGFASGTTSVSRDGLAMIHEGETISQRGTSGRQAPFAGSVNFYVLPGENPEDFMRRSYAELQQLWRRDMELMHNV